MSASCPQAVAPPFPPAESARTPAARGRGTVSERVWILFAEYEAKYDEPEFAECLPLAVVRTEAEVKALAESMGAWCLSILKEHRADRDCSWNDIADPDFGEPFAGPPAPHGVYWDWEAWAFAPLRLIEFWWLWAPVLSPVSTGGVA